MKTEIKVGLIPSIILFVICIPIILFILCIIAVLLCIYCIYIGIDWLLFDLFIFRLGGKNERRK